MIGIIRDAFIAAGCETGFRTAFKRARHLRVGHPFEKSTRLEKRRFYAHPNNDVGYCYTVNLMRCDDCGLCWIDEGFETAGVKNGEQPYEHNANNL